MLNASHDLKILLLSALTTNTLAGELQVLVTDEQGNPKPDAVIELFSTGILIPPDWPMSGVMDQIDKEFVGPVLAVVAGSSVSFPNSDDVHHHVYSFSPAKRFELPLYTGNAAAPVIFETAGVVTIGCNIHDWMVGYIYVGHSHLIAVTQADGSARIANLPDGSYTAKLWHSGLGPGQDGPQFDFDIAGDNSVQHQISLQQPPAQTLRRAPLPGMRQY